jgi:hypothetical protein
MQATSRWPVATPGPKVQRPPDLNENLAYRPYTWRGLDEGPEAMAGKTSAFIEGAM